MKLLIFMLWIAILSPVGAVWAQLPAANDFGVAMALVQYNVRDLDANKKFWTAMGATPGKAGNFEFMKLPTVLIVLKHVEPMGGSDGAVLQHVTFKVANPQEFMSRMKDAGYKTEPGGNPRQVYIYSPEDVKIEILEDTALTVPIAVHHIHYYVGEQAAGGPGGISEMQAWYVKMLGAKADAPPQNQSSSADRLGASLPGTNLTFSKSPTATASSKGRQVDHVGFEVKNLEEFCKKLQAGGVKFERAYAKNETTDTASATFIDPWGTPVELTEGLRRLL